MEPKHGAGENPILPRDKESAVKTEVKIKIYRPAGSQKPGVRYGRTVVVQQSPFWRRMV